MIVATCRPAAARLDQLQFINEATVGGPIVRDKLWFFGAMRLQETSDASRCRRRTSVHATDENKRGEIKFTGTAASNHTFQGGYLNNKTKQEIGRRSHYHRPHGLITVPLPNWLAFGNYRGILRNDLLVEAQFSQRKFQFHGSGGTSPNIVDSPIITLSQTLGHYNAPYFDATDPENRNNQQLTGNLTYFRNTERAGTRSRSATSGSAASGPAATRSRRPDMCSTPTTRPMQRDVPLDAQGYLIPVFVPGETYIETGCPSGAPS